MLRPYIPPTHIADIIDRHVFQTRFTEHLGDPAAPRRFRSGGRGNRGQRGLTRQRRFIRALDMRPRSPDAIVREECVDHASKL